MEETPNSLAVLGPLARLGQLKRYIEYLEDYYRNPITNPEIASEVNNAFQQMTLAIGAINAKFDYTSMILDKLYKAIKEFGFNSVCYEYACCSGIYELVLDRDNKKITGELCVPWPRQTLLYNYICVLENDDIDGPPDANYRINVIITPLESNPKKSWDKPSDEYYRCSPFTDFAELIATTCDEYT